MRYQPLSWDVACCTAVGAALNYLCGYNHDACVLGAFAAGSLITACAMRAFIRLRRRMNGPTFLDGMSA